MAALPSLTAVSLDAAQRSLAETLAAEVGVDLSSCAPEARFVDLGLDSVGMLILLSLLEAHGVVVDEGMRGLERVSDLMALLESVSPASRAQLARRSEAPLLTPLDRGATVGARGGRPATVVLRPVLDADFDYLYTLATGVETGWRWRLRAATPSPEDFRRLLWGHMLAQQVVTTRGGERIGLVQADRLHRNGYAFLAALFEEGAQLTGLALQAVGLFVDAVFAAFDIVRLFAEVPGFNYPYLRSGAGRFFEVCGVLPEHDFARGRYWDLHLLTIEREQWELEARPILSGPSAGTPIR
jgi:RimJ/RimL family protein N-acetyltransferase/aryl carrier-like protein